MLPSHSLVNGGQAACVCARVCVCVRAPLAARAKGHGGARVGVLKLTKWETHEQYLCCGWDGCTAPAQALEAAYPAEFCVHLRGHVHADGHEHQPRGLRLDAGERP